MKQGIVMEIKNKKAIVLTQEGTFETVSLKKGQQIEIGSEINVPVAKRFFNPAARRISTIVAAAAVLVLLLTQYPFVQNSNLAVAAYVGLDINPSIEVGINEKLKVVEVIPINDDGKIIVDQIGDNYRNKSLSQFIDSTIELAKADGYLTEKKDVLLTTTMVKKDAQVKIEENVNVIKKEIEQSGVAVTTLKVDENTRKEAKDNGVSTGKYMIYKESKENLTIEETKELSVTEIYEKVEKGKKQKDKKEKEQKNGNIEKNKVEKIVKETKKEQKANEKQQKLEDKKNDKKINKTPVQNENKYKNKERDPSNEPPGKSRVRDKENDGGYEKGNKNKTKDSRPKDLNDSEKQKGNQKPKKEKREEDNNNERKDKNERNKKDD